MHTINNISFDVSATQLECYFCGGHIQAGHPVALVPIKSCSNAVHIYCERCGAAKAGIDCDPVSMV